MYSYEDRLRAVRLYIKLGLRVGPTIRQLGYPTKNSLKNWHQEYVQRHDLAAGYERSPKYSQAQKARAVEHYLEHGLDAQLLDAPFRCRHCRRYYTRGAAARPDQRRALTFKHRVALNRAAWVDRHGMSWQAYQ